jgi:hypothetical protein
MSVNISQSGDGGAGLQGKDGGTGTFINGTQNYNVPVAATAVCLLNVGRSMVIDSIVCRPFVAGTGGAATISVYKAASGTAPASGTVLHSGTANMVGTINTDQYLTLTTTQVAAGESIWAVFTGTATSAIGALSINCRPA